jgi:nicotinate-nucleotide adenylyltransferase
MLFSFNKICHNINYKVFGRYSQGSNWGTKFAITGQQAYYLDQDFRLAADGSFIAMSAKTMGILGGTFDPVHYGHLSAAECVRCEFGLDKVIFMLSAQPPHKKGQRVSAASERLAMVQSAIADNPAFQASALEMQRPGYSYTVDTIEYCLAASPGMLIYFILGVDALQLISTWKDYTRLVGLCQFIAITRPGFTLDPDDAAFADVPRTLWKHLHLLEIPGNLVSSSDIRDRVKNGKTIKYLVPPAVEEYIYSKGLYREENNQ